MRNKDTFLNIILKQSTKPNKGDVLHYSIVVMISGKVRIRIRREHKGISRGMGLFYFMCLKVTWLLTL